MHLPPITSPLVAVRAAMVAEHRVGIIDDYNPG
jgi:hypothetical protein